MSINNKIESKVLKQDLVNWQSFQFIQGDSFKVLLESERKRLLNSLRNNEFIDPFKVWEHEGVIYCLDGKHRYDALVSLRKEGFEVPDLLPATFIECIDKEDAAKKVLIYSAQYAQITSEGLSIHLEEYNIDVNNLDTMMSIKLPEIEQHAIPEELTEGLKDKPPTIKITFENTDQLLEAEKAIIELLNNNYPKAFYSMSCGEI